MNTMGLSLSQRDYEESNFSIRYTAFKNRLEKFIDAGEEKIRKMEIDGWNHSTAYKSRYAAFCRVVDCYIDLYNREPKNDAELDDIIWLFNDGSLRTRTELDAKQKELEQREYREKKLNRKLWTIEDFSDSRRKMVRCLRIALALLLALGLWKLASSFWDGILIWPFLLALPVTWLGSYLLTGLITLAGDANDERDRYEAKTKAGSKYKPNAQSIVDAASYGAALLMAVSMKPKKRTRRR